MRKKNIELKHQSDEDEIWRLILPSAVAELGFSHEIVLNIGKTVFVFYSFSFPFNPGVGIEYKKYIYTLMNKLLIAILRRWAP